MNTNNSFLLTAITVFLPLISWATTDYTSTVTANGLTWYVELHYASESPSAEGTSEIRNYYGNSYALTSDPVGSISIPSSVKGSYNRVLPMTRVGDYALAACINVTDVTIPNSVTSIGESAFNGCWGLVSVKLPSSLTKIEKLAFHYCKSLKTISLPSGVKEIGDNAFAYCSSLKSIDIPDGVTKIGYGVFQKCSQLKTIKIPTSVTSLGLAVFSGCSGLETVYLPSRFRSTVSKLEIPSGTSIVYYDDSPTLGVTSDYGTPTPAAGTSQYDYNETVSARVAAPAAANGTRRVCTGWTGTGSVPASGTGTNVTFAITENSTIRWNWRTDYWIDLSSSGPVSPSFSSSWVQSGGTVTVTWPDPGATTVVKVSGDTAGTTFDEAGRTLTIPADGPRAIALAATTLTLADAVDAPALVWSTGALAPWAPQASTTKDGEDAAMSAGIGGGETSALETTVAGSGTLSWSWRLDRGDVAGIDLFVDGTLVESLETAGEWIDSSFAIQGDGEHCIRFEYWNESGSAANRGYVDCISWTGDAPETTVWYVDAATGDDSNIGRSWASAKATIQSALDAASDGDTILVKPGVYKEDRHTTGGLSNDNGMNIVIRSADGPLATALDGDGKRRVVKGTGTSTQNTWTDHCLTLDGFTIRGGSNGGVGVAAYCKIQNCILCDNDAGMGSAVDFSRLENCLVYGNVASNATDAAKSKLFDRSAIINCTIVGNRLADATTGAMFERCTVENSIFAGNDCGSGALFGNGTTVSSSCSDVGADGSGNIVANATEVFVDAANGNYRLRDDSPCIDAGDSAYSMVSVDLAGNPRVKGRAIDMGCYEFQAIQTETWTTPVAVPYVWLDEFRLGDGTEDGYEAAAWSDAANGVNEVWECYVAGLDPTNATSQLLATIDMADEAADVRWTPDLNEGGTKNERVYTVEGKTNLVDKAWGPTNEATRFFRVKVRMLE